MRPYYQPTSLSEALALLASREALPLAGGTDVYPGLANGADPPGLLDITRIEELGSGIVERDADWLIRPLTTWSEIVAASLPPYFAGVKEAALEIGGRQIQNRATLVGNICNASPAADGTVALMSLDAVVLLASATAQRRVPLVDFVIGNRQTARRPDELVVGIEIPKLVEPAASAFKKLGARRYLVISIVMAAVTLAVKDRTILRAAVAVGSCSARAVRIGGLEQSLRGRRLDQVAGDLAAGEPFAEISPISDIRSSAEYRAHAAREIVAEALHACIARIA
jgi:CO/xanthine dehydrogenase FAD-binding subunit